MTIRYVKLLLLASFLCACSSYSNQNKVNDLFIPQSSGQQLLFIGQDSDTIDEYQQRIPNDILEGITLYTQLKSADPAKTLFGLRENSNWQAGDVDFSHSLSKAPYAGLAVGLAFDSCDQEPHGEHIANGDYDASIDYMVKWFKQLAPRPVFLRIGYEFDGPWNCYQQTSYKRAFNRIATALKAAKADNVVTVWQSATWPDPTIGGDRQLDFDHRNPTHLNDWYPGGADVDWIAISTFYRDLHQWVYVPVDTPQAAQQKVLDFARREQKPVMIAEAAPQAYNLAKLTRGFTSLNQQVSVSAEQVWVHWYQPLFEFIHKNNDVIKALAYINTHWESQPMWYCAAGGKAGTAECPQGYWGDTRVQANEYIRTKWLMETQNASRWVQGSWWPQ